MTADTNEVEMVAETQPDAERPLTAFGALLGVIIRPRATFRRMREAKRGHWWVVLALTLVTLVVLTLVTSNVRTKQLAEFQAQREAELAESGEEASAPSGGAQGGGPGGGGGPPGGGPGFGGGPGGNPIGLLIRQVGGGPGGATGAARSQGALGTAIGVGVGLISALLGYLARGLLLFLLGLVLGGRATFKQVFRMGVWTTLPGVLRNVMQLAAMLATGNPPASGLAGIAFGAGGMAEISPMMLALLRGIDIYLLWSLILIGVGVAATSQLSRIKSTVVALAYWLLTVAVSMVGQR